jgi:cyclopropane-fatty-acyl-phospholipid synthase
MVSDLRRQANGSSGPGTSISSGGVWPRSRLATWPRADVRHQGDGAAPGGKAGPSAPPSAAEVLAPLFKRLFPDRPPVNFVFWDQSRLGPSGSPGRAIGSGSWGWPGSSGAPGTAVVRSPNALRRILWSPNELGLARAFVAGDIDVEGDMYGVLRALRESTGTIRFSGPQAIAAGLSAAARLGAVGPPLKHPDVEVRLSGWLHSKRRDAAAIKHHYDISDDFYRIVLGPAMTYSCARWEPGQTSLEEAQRSKHDLICRKLGLRDRPHVRLLDVGCGWGSMVLHAAKAYGAKAVAITLSPAQARSARVRVFDAGALTDVEVRLQDYRDVRGETFDAISSIGMFEHVGTKHMPEYFDRLFSLLVPGGRLLNHAISKPGGKKMRGATFINRYVFPDGELIDVGDVVREMERAGFEVRDVESLREHYAKTLRAWVTNLEASWDDAVKLVGEQRARVWRLYMTASANGFEEGVIAVHQVLGVRPRTDGTSGMPPTRASWG